MTGTNKYSRATSVSAGSLIVNGSINSSTVSVVGSGILGGSGTVGPVINKGVVNPGSPGASGILNVAGNLTLGPGTLVLDLAAAGSDSINVPNLTSNVNIIGTTLSLNVGTITPGESFTILNVPGTNPSRLVSSSACSASNDFDHVGRLADLHHQLPGRRR